jgi:bifunctional non-homologous end joining protein LigD
MDDPILPQQPTDAKAEVLSVEWLFEPVWPGRRLIARRDEFGVHLTDELGDPADNGLAEVRALLERSIIARQAIVDGVWTAQPFVGDGSPARAWADTLAEEGLSGQLPDPVTAERRRAFVAIDLLELEGEPLLDVPLQERRRLLESIIDEGVQVRVSPVVKQPIAGWMVGWRTNGFSHYLAKHMNSRYEPGTRSEDWLRLSLSSDPPRGIVGRLVGIGRAGRVRRIRD